MTINDLHFSANIAASRAEAQTSFVDPVKEVLGSLIFMEKARGLLTYLIDLLKIQPDLGRLQVHEGKLERSLRTAGAR